MTGQRENDFNINEARFRLDTRMWWNRPPGEVVDACP